MRRLDFGKKRGIYEFSTYDPETKIHRRPRGLHPYAEVGVVLEGKMEVNLDGTVYLLGPGDSIYIKPNLYHTMRNAAILPAAPSGICRLWMILYN
ncbi:MAG: cupin domain-containing protein [Clostridium fessum]